MRIVSYFNHLDGDKFALLPKDNMLYKSVVWHPESVRHENCNIISLQRIIMPQTTATAAEKATAVEKTTLA